MTRSDSAVYFGPYRLEPNGPRLLKGDAAVALQPRPLAVLCYLAARPGQLIGRDELIRTMWAGTYVTRGVLKVAVRAIREALGDDVESPRYIETVGREGYRFIAADADAATGEAKPPAAGAMVGRGRELGVLRAAVERASRGARHVVFVTGEAGIGKTMLVEQLLDEVERNPNAWVGCGQCVEQYGGGEPYLPVLEAIGRLARDDASGEVARVLRRHAPTWASQLPALDADDAAAAPDGGTAAATSPRMLREIADALEVLTRDRTLVLVLEDLHWSDASTIDLIAYVARRRETARLLLIGTFRPADAIITEHPIRRAKRELQAREECEDLALEPLSLDDVRAYVDARFSVAAPDQMQRLAKRVHQRTDGNALFMVDIVNDLVAQETLVWRDGRWQVIGSVTEATSRIPAGVRGLVEHRLQRLSPAMRAALEAASVVGDEFAVATVAAALDDEPTTVEDLFETLAAPAMLIDDAGVAESADGTLAGRYRFLHALYRQVVYEGIGAARRVRLHRAIGLHEEQAGGGIGGGHTAELAMHFERARDHERALAYHELAGATALERHAAHEAAAHFGAALEALAQTRPGPERAERELGLVLSRATLLQATRGYGAPETEEAFARARTLCDASPGSPSVDPVLRGLLSFRHARAELRQAFELGELMLRRASSPAAGRAVRVQAHYGHGVTLFHIGMFDAAREHFEKALAAYDSESHAEHLRVYGGYDPGVACTMWLGLTLALLGRLEDAAACDRQGFERAQRLSDPFSLAWGYYATCVAKQFFGDWAASERDAAEAARLSEEHGFPHTLAIATASLGWARIMQGSMQAGIPMLREGVAAVDATGAKLVRPQYLSMLAAVDAIEGRLDAAAARIDEALAEVERTEERWHLVHLLVAKSRFLDPGDASAEHCLERALDVARSQGSRMLELRAAVALARRWRERGRPAEARALLAGAHACFAEAPPLVPDIRSARRLLAELG
jgi:DNA-binding winged helix-turn-helix (wHTH) protein/tetratricopeptide (TPR) repeat protein